MIIMVLVNNILTPLSLSVYQDVINYLNVLQKKENYSSGNVTYVTIANFHLSKIYYI
jgi:hypothetical protein